MRAPKRLLLLLIVPVLLLPATSRERAVAGSAERARDAYDGHAPAPCGEWACPVCCAAWEVGLRMVPLRTPVITRCEGLDDESHLLAPRGRLRPADLAEARVLLALDVPDRLELVLESAGAPAGPIRFPFEAVYMDQHVPLPHVLARELARAAPACVHVRLEGAGRTWAESLLHLTAPGERAERWLDGVAAALARHPESVRRLVLSRALLEEDFDVAAWREAEAVLVERPDEPHAAALAHVALARLGLLGLGPGIDARQRVREILRARTSAGAQPAGCRVLDEADAADPAWDVARHGAISGGRASGPCGP